MNSTVRQSVKSELLFVNSEIQKANSAIAVEEAKLQKLRENLELRLGQKRELEEFLEADNAPDA